MLLKVLEFKSVLIFEEILRKLPTLLTNTNSKVKQPILQLQTLYRSIKLYKINTIFNFMHLPGDLFGVEFVFFFIVMGPSL